jgi:heptosyltransferase II
MVMAQSLFKTLKENDPTAQIDVLAPNWSRPLLERMPEVRASHVIPIGHGKLALQTRYQIAQSLKPLKFDQSIVLPNSWKSALIPWWADIPKRTGFLGEWRFGLLNDSRVLDKKRLPRMIDRFAALAFPKNADPLIHVPHPRLEINPENVQRVVEKFSLQAQLNAKILALCPGAEFGPSKRWPEDYYAKIASLKQKEGWKVWIFGSQNDSPVAKSIQAALDEPCVDLTGKTGLDEAIDLLSITSLVLTNDSGLMHIAAALDKPLVAVYGSTDPGFTPPLGNQSKIARTAIACSPCFKRECPLLHHRCMRDLLPERILAEINSMVV